MATINGDGFDNILNGIAGESNVIFGRGGNDTLTGVDYDDPLSGPNEFGSDFIYGNDGDDILYGMAGDDYLVGDGYSFSGESGNDTMYGGDGDDYLRGGAGVDYFDGGAGDDRISLFHLDATQGAVASLLNRRISNDGFGNVETFVGIENIGQGTAFADNFTGNNNANLFLADTSDTIRMLGGDDTVQVSGAAALLHGGNGTDTITVFTLQTWVPDTDSDGFAEAVNATHGVTVDLSAGKIVDDGFGNSGKLVSIENVGGSNLDDVLIGDRGDNVLAGYDGADTLTGGRGADTFDYDLANNSTADPAGRDTIADFNAGDDAIDLSGVADEAAVSLTLAGAFTGVAGQVTVTATTGGSLVEADLNGDMASDFAILVLGDIPLAGNFIL
jgi:Ca2+-binding RTX toxin-like protein